MPIQTIGFGTPAAVDETLLKNISLETSGVSYISANATTMFDVLGLTLVALLKGNTASMALIHHDTMTGAGPSAPQPVIVDRSAQRVVFAVQWAPPTREALDLEVFRPNGAAATPDSSESTPQSSIRTFNIKPGDVGKWSFRVKRRTKSSQSVPYSVNALVLEKHLDYRLSFDQPRVAAGDPITVRAVIAWDGKPLTGLPAGAIRVRVQQPGAALGNILHDTRFPDKSTGTTTTPAGDKLTPYDRKVAGLSADILKRTQMKEVATIELKEQGKGVYAGTFDQTNIPGGYGFDAVLDWDDVRTGHTRRVERIEQLVKLKVDAGRTDVVTTHPDSRTFRIAVTPRDKSGNFRGPGYASVVKAKLNGAGKLSGPADPNQTGTYVFTVTGVPAGTTPDLEITVDGVILKKP